MSSDQNFYAAPDAELGDDTDQSKDLDSGGPTTVGDTLRMIIDLFPKTILPLVGYLVMYFVVVIGGVAVWMGVVEMTPEGTSVELTILGGTLVMLAMAFVVTAFVWTAAFKHIDNAYRGDSTQGALQFATGKFLPVTGAFFLKALIFVPFWGLFFALVWNSESTGSEPGLGMMCGMWILMLIGYCIYLYVHFADLVIIVEDTGVIESLKRSYELVRGNWWYTVGCLFVIGLIVGGIGGILNMVLMFVAGAAGAGAGAAGAGEAGAIIAFGIVGLLYLLIMLITYPIYGMANYAIFESLRARNRWS